MKKKTMIIFNTIAIVLTLTCTIALTYGWYVNSDNMSVSLAGGSAGGYFRGGKGTSDDPYEISNSRHMYNFAWLQNNGKYIDDSENQTKLYFELVNADGNNGIIDMESIIIPPIGNDKYPFIGEFNGNGCSLKNLVVSTDYNVIYNGAMLKNQKYQFSNAVGLFGKTGENSVIKNFILNNPTIEADSYQEITTDNGQTFINYTSNEKINSTSTTALKNSIGLAVGYVASAVSSIGVYGGILSNERTENCVTYNSILGELSDSVIKDSDITGSVTSPTGGDIGYFVPDKILDKINEYKTSGDHLDINNKFLYDNLGTSTTSNGSITGYTLKNDMIITANDSKTLGDLSLGSFSLLTAKGTNSSDTFAANTTDNYMYDQITLLHFYTGDKLEANYKAGGYYEVDFSQQNGYYSSSLGSSYTEDEKKIAATKDDVLSNVKYVDERIYSFESTLTFGSSMKTGNTSEYLVFEDGTLGDEEDIGTLGFTKYSACAALKLSDTVSSNNPAKLFIIAATARSTSGRILAIYDKDANIVNQMFLPGANTYKNYPTTNAKQSTIVGGYFELTSGGNYYIGSTNGRIAILYISVIGVETGQEESEGSYDSEKTVSGVDFIYNNVSINQNTFEFEDNLTSEYSYSQLRVFYDDSQYMNHVVLYFDRNSSTTFILTLYLSTSAKKPKTTGSGSDTDRLTIKEDGEDLNITV